MRCRSGEAGGAEADLRNIFTITLHLHNTPTERSKGNQRAVTLTATARA